MRVFVRPEAENDLRAAHRWYENQRAELGEEFIAEVDATFTRIIELPRQFPVMHRDLRRALLKRFPYAVFYLLEPDRVVIVAVLNQASDPDRWRGRAP